MYSKITKIKINDETFYVHTDILRKYHYFNTILDQKFAEKDIDIQIELKNITPTEIVDILYFQQVTSKSLKTKQFAELTKIIDYLQPNNPQLLDKLSKTYSRTKLFDFKNKDAFNEYLHYLVYNHVLDNVRTDYIDFMGCHSLDGGDFLKQKIIDFLGQNGIIHSFDDIYLGYTIDVGPYNQNVKSCGLKYAEITIKNKYNKPIPINISICGDESGDITDSLIDFIIDELCD